MKKNLIYGEDEIEGMEREQPGIRKEIELLQTKAMDALWEQRVLLPDEVETKEECYKAFLKLERSEEEFAMFEVGFIRACELILRNVG